MQRLGGRKKGSGKFYGKTVRFRLTVEDEQQLKRVAEQQGTSPDLLARVWALEKLRSV